MKNKKLFMTQEEREFELTMGAREYVLQSFDDTVKNRLTKSDTKDIKEEALKEMNNGK